MITLTVQLALLPFEAVAVIFATPFLRPFTRPVLLTDAIDVSSVVHVMVLFVASSGAIEGVSWYVLPILTEIEDLSSLTEVTCCLTVTLHLAVNEPSALLAVITVVPA